VCGSRDARPLWGDPPAEAATDTHPIAERVDFDNESVESAYDLPFEVERPPGHYYLQVRAILFRLRTGQVIAQAEQFFSADVRWRSSRICRAGHGAGRVASALAGRAAHLRSSRAARRQAGRTRRWQQTAGARSLTQTCSSSSPAAAELGRSRQAGRAGFTNYPKGGTPSRKQNVRQEAFLSVLAVVACGVAAVVLSPGHPPLVGKRARPSSSLRAAGVGQRM